MHEISDIKKFPKEMTVQDILVQSSNIGTIKIARLIGQERLKSFLKDINILEYPNLELDELGRPIQFEWTKCQIRNSFFWTWNNNNTFTSRYCLCIFDKWWQVNNSNT